MGANADMSGAMQHQEMHTKTSKQLLRNTPKRERPRARNPPREAKGIQRNTLLRSNRSEPARDREQTGRPNNYEEHDTRGKKTLSRRKRREKAGYQANSRGSKECDDAREIRLAGKEVKQARVRQPESQLREAPKTRTGGHYRGDAETIVARAEQTRTSRDRMGRTSETRITAKNTERKTS